jgi:hypothetical protein
MGVMSTVSNSPAGRWLKAAAVCLSLLPGLASGSNAIAESLGLPETRHLAAALSDPESRIDTLMTLAAVQHLMDYGRYARLHEASQYAERFREDRAWLDRLAARYPAVPMRSSLLDPSAWHLLLELDQHDLSPGPAVSPFGPGTDALLSQLFDRSAELSAATVLPEVLSRMEADSTVLWQDLLASADDNMTLELILRQLNEQWFDVWAAAEPPAPVSQQGDDSVIDSTLEMLDGFAATAQRAGPPDALALKRLRFMLLNALPDLGWQQSADAAYLLTLANAVDGLYRKQYLSFTESMLWVAAGLLASEIPVRAPVEEAGQDSPFMPLPDIVLEPLPGEEPYRSRIPGTLTELLPALSAVFEEGFNEVDARLSTGLASVFDVAQYIRSGEGDPDQLASLRFGIADSVAQFVLLVPDMDFYFSQPVRREISSEVNICISRAARRDELGSSALNRDEFENCMENLAQLASTRVTSAELAGDPDGPFAMEQLQRELMLPPWQRINFVLGYLLENHTTACDAPDEELPNPLEWSGLVTVMTWFARQSPVFFQAPENEAMVASLRQQGHDMLTAMAQQVDCINGAGSGIVDPVTSALVDYGESLDTLVAGIRETELVFREDRLKPGSDIVLNGGAGQHTAYQPDGLAIGPCDERYICEMAANIEAGPELVALFPDAYLVADQAGLGSVEICYDNLQWVSRRSEPVREDDPHVANYFGRFSFDLFGRYREGDETREVFGFNFISPDEYHYLFGAASEDVLNDRCPMERVGERITTPLGNDRIIRVVPDRLTYLAAARTLPSVLIGGNWDRNQRWRDAFITGQGVKRHDFEPDETFLPRLEQHLLGLHQAEQAAVYSALLNPPPRSWRRGRESLYGWLRELGTHKDLVRAYINLFYPQVMMESDELRGLLEGREALLDESTMRSLRREGVAATAVNGTGRGRLEALFANWKRQPEPVRRTGSVHTSLVHAIIRLDALYRDFFAPTPPPSPVPVKREEVLSFEELDG